MGQVVVMVALLLWAVVVIHFVVEDINADRKTKVSTARKIGVVAIVALAYAVLVLIATLRGGFDPVKVGAFFLTGMSFQLVMRSVARWFARRGKKR
jgi:TRAP-type C4-dicarboxylate transport system permease large subunit